MLKWIHQLGDPSAVARQATAILHALQADVKFFEKDRQGEILGGIRSAIGSDDPHKAVWDLLDKFLTGAWGISEYNMNKVQVAEQLNQMNSDTSPITIMKTLRIMIGEIEITGNTQKKMPFPLQIMQGKNYNKYLRRLDAERSMEPFDKKYVGSNFAQTLHYQAKYMRVTPIYNNVINRYKNLLFYMNFDNRLSKYLTWFKQTHDIRGDPPSWDYEAPQRTEKQLSYPISNEDLVQFELIAQEVTTWENYQRVARGEQPVPPSKGGRGGGGGRSGS
jgi:hypothetical protein